jgi:histidinol-phosphate/aromatic aminotransferase/cobyric acid decarboxylase-like protein/adenosyl cobinamide kinase/adenosyl cobinamide phosphate guanylyltransferase
LILVIGGTRSGKSAHAEALALGSGLPVRYVGTADESDGSMSRRVAAHVARRPSGWETFAAQDDLASLVSEGGLTLIDGIGVWIAGRDRGRVEAEIGQLIEASRSEDVIVVSEEAGQGLLPLDPISREWLDLLGESTQRLSAAAVRVDYVVAGRPMTLANDGRTVSGNERDLRHHGDREVRPGDTDHAVNVLAGGLAPWLASALTDALAADTIRYPDDTATVAAIATRHERELDEIVITNGAAEALWLLGSALQPRLAAIVNPAFTESEAALRAHGIPVVRVQRDPAAGFALGPAAVPVQADLVIVGNPGSPDGTLHPVSSLMALRAPGRVLVVDEAFLSMVPGEPESLASETLDDVIVVRSLTKLLSVPGLRAGYALAAPPLATALSRVKPPWSANALALAALLAASTHQAELAALAERATNESIDLQQRLAQIPDLRLWPSVTNFALIEVPDGPAVVETLRRQRLAVRPAASFPGLGAGHIRITARDAPANERLAAALAAAMDGDR